jgi:hypothetical protein
MCLWSGSQLISEACCRFLTCRRRRILGGARQVRCQLEVDLERCQLVWTFANLNNFDERGRIRFQNMLFRNFGCELLIGSPIKPFLFSFFILPLFFTFWFVVVESWNSFDACRFQRSLCVSWREKQLCPNFAHYPTAIAPQKYVFVGRVDSFNRQRLSRVAPLYPCAAVSCQKLLFFFHSESFFRLEFSEYLNPSGRNIWLSVRDTHFPLCYMLGGGGDLFSSFLSALPLVKRR